MLSRLENYLPVRPVVLHGRNQQDVNRERQVIAIAYGVLPISGAFFMVQDPLTKKI